MLVDLLYGARFSSLGAYYNQTFFRNTNILRFVFQYYVVHLPGRPLFFGTEHSTLTSAPLFP
jgi:hypothetical protein